MSISLNACVRREIRATAMDGSDDDDMCREGAEDGASESIAHDSSEGEEEEEEEDDGVIVDADSDGAGGGAQAGDSGSDKEADEDEEEDTVDAVAEHAEEGKAGNTEWFKSRMAPLWITFPSLRCLSAVTHFGVVKEESVRPGSDPTPSFISGKPSTHVVKAHRRNSSCLYIHFAGDKESETLRCFFTMASFMRPTWRGYKVHNSKRLAEWFSYAMNYIQDVEYVRR